MWLVINNHCKTTREKENWKQEAYTLEERYQFIVYDIDLKGGGDIQDTRETALVIASWQFKGSNLLPVSGFVA